MEAKALRCPGCGAPVPPDASQCPYCEAQLATVACPACFALVPLSADPCPACGQRMNRVNYARRTGAPPSWLTAAGLMGLALEVAGRFLDRD